jgi:hypothetical protein
VNTLDALIYELANAMPELSPKQAARVLRAVAVASECSSTDIEDVLRSFVNTYKEDSFTSPWRAYGLRPFVAETPPTRPDIEQLITDIKALTDRVKLIANTKLIDFTDEFGETRYDIEPLEYAHWLERRLCK